MRDRSINATIVLGASTYTLTKLLTIDQDYGWTIFEILWYMPEHNWSAYEEALKANPVLANMMISDFVYSLGDWIAQCYEGKPIFEFDRTRMFRSSLVGFTLHGSLLHYYYHFYEVPIVILSLAGTSHSLLDFHELQFHWPIALVSSCVSTNLIVSDWPVTEFAQGNCDHDLCGPRAVTR